MHGACSSLQNGVGLPLVPNAVRQRQGSIEPARSCDQARSRRSAYAIFITAWPLRSWVVGAIAVLYLTASWWNTCTHAARWRALVLQPWSGLCVALAWPFSHDATTHSQAMMIQVRKMEPHTGISCPPLGSHHCFSQCGHQVKRPVDSCRKPVASSIQTPGSSSNMDKTCEKSSCLWKLQPTIW